MALAASDLGVRTALVFGANGAIGRAVSSAFVTAGHAVVGVCRSLPKDGLPARAQAVVAPDPEAAVDASLALHRRYDAVVWAQGANTSDSVRDFDEAEHLRIYDANCLFVLKSLRRLLATSGLASGGARLCAISSIWQDLARQDKLSYVMSKAALGGLVRSASIDLGDEGHLINAILPGPLDTPMAHANLAPAQLAGFVSATRHARLPDMDTVADLALFLCSPGNRSLTGQSIAVDLGYSHVRNV